MPLHRIFSPLDVFSKDDKKAIAERVTALYTAAGLPAFYVVVVFIPVDAESFLVGGEPSAKFVRIVSQHLARHFQSSEAKAAFVDQLEGAFAPYIKERGLDWELHIEEVDRETWRENGLVPPLPQTDAEKHWAKVNKAVAYEPL